MRRAPFYNISKIIVGLIVHQKAKTDTETFMNIIVVFTWNQWIRFSITQNRFSHIFYSTIINSIYPVMKRVY